MAQDILDMFLKQYAQAKAKAIREDNPLYALIDNVRETLGAFMPLDSQMTHTFENLTKSIQEPIKVAIIGQFSSGKSTFLNALLGKDILPSGVIPITAKVCHIVYGADYSLELHYKNGLIVSKPIDFFHHISDAQNATIAFYKLYAPLMLLKHISFLDTPGFNSQNQSDTETTNAILQSVDGIIWLTLIDNVGKQSEKDTIALHIKRYASKSLCVLNQKDRCKSADEVNTSLSYARKAFNGLFEDIIAISAKNALLAASIESGTIESSQAQALRADSNIDSVMAFLQLHIAPLAAQAKAHRIKRHLRAYTLRFARLNLHALLRLSSLEAYFSHTLQQLTHNALQSAFYKHFPTLFDSLNDALYALTQHIYNALEKTSHTFTRTHKKFGLNAKYVEQKEIVSLPYKHLARTLSDTNSPTACHFTQLGFEIMHTAEEFKELLEAHLQPMEAFINQWYEQFIPQLQNPLLRTQLSEMVNAFNSLADTHYADLKSHLFLLQKILHLNYDLSLNFCLNTLALRIEESLEKHRSNAALPLFNPSLENIFDELKYGFHFHILQANLQTQPLHTKSMWHFEHAYKQLFAEKSTFIHDYKKRYNESFMSLKALLKELKYSKV